MVSSVTNNSESLFDFGPLAGVYEDWYNTSEGQAHDRVQQKDVGALLPPSEGRQRLLDVGCGTGHWCRFFHALGYDVQGVDISEEMVAAAKKALPECHFDVADACAIPFEDKTFDVTASITALEFIPDQGAAVREMVRCTRLGGFILIGTLNKTAPINRERMAAGEPPFSFAHLLEPTELLELLAPFGKIRMTASPVPGPWQEPVLISADRGLSEIKDLAGPLLVAEVRRQDTKGSQLNL